MRRLLILTPLLVLAGATQAHAVVVPAPESTKFKYCDRVTIARCGNVIVPLERPTPSGTVSLRVRRVDTRGPRKGAVIALAGGPGQAATPFAEYVAYTLRRALAGREVVTFDQRGIGRSGQLRCPTLEAVGDDELHTAGAAADCAERIGPRRAFYTTRDSVEDMEAVRRALHVDRIIVYGVSYGTKLALAYAAAYPQHVERLVLDSVVPTYGPDPFLRDNLEAVPRILRALCDARCEGVTQDPAADLAALVSRLGNGLLHGPLVRFDGRPYTARFGRVRLLDILFSGDFDPGLRAAMPAALRSALNGDAAPILRLAHRSSAITNDPISYFNPAVYAATSCEEGPLPWSRSSPMSARFAEAKAMFDPTPDAALGGFDRLTAFIASSPLQLCRLWPSALTEPALKNGPFPAVPALVLSGEDDMRTPLEDAAAVAKQLPRSTFLTVPDVGHSVLDWPNAGCARRALGDFLADRAIVPCRRQKRLIPLDPLAPTSLDQLEPARGVPGKPGRTVAAIVRTLADSGSQIESGLFVGNVFRVGVTGLRNGRVVLTSYGYGLDELEYVPGVKLSGQLRGRKFSRGFIRVSGRAAARGLLRLRHGVLSGRLGGKRVRLPIPSAFPRPQTGALSILLDVGSSRRRTPLAVGGLPVPRSVHTR
jgi:pimeloyl-ACP methyl ester carboxylesterase